MKNKELNKQIERKWIIAIILFGLLILSLGFVLTNFNWLRFTGFAIEQNISSDDMENLETVVENYETDSVNLNIKEPVSSGLLGVGEPITKNKNKRIEFSINGKNLRLYFDLLNYSEFVEGIASSSLVENVRVANLTETNITIVNETINKVTEIVNETINKVTEIVNETKINESQINITEITNETKEAEEIVINKTEEEVSGGSGASESGESEQTKQEENENTKEEKQEEKETKGKTKEKKKDEKQEENRTGIIGNIVRFFGLIGREIAGSETNVSEEINQTKETNKTNGLNIGENDTKEIEFNEIKQSLNNLTKTEIETISDNSVISAENFDIIINSSRINQSDPEYKWGYKVKLNDLKFLAKIEVTSNEAISKYNENTLKIGKRNLLSFEDLTEAGYKIRIETPALEIPVNITIKNETILIKNITIENKTIQNITKTNLTQVNLTRANITILNITETNFSLANITISNQTANEIKEITNETLVNDTSEITNETKITNITEEKIKEEENKTAEKEEKKEEKAEIKEEEKVKEEAKEEKQEEKETKGKTKEEKQETKPEPKEKKKEEVPIKTPIEQTPTLKVPAKQPAIETPTAETSAKPAPEIGITGNIIRFFKLTGKAIFGIASSVADASEVTGKAIVTSTGKVIGLEENVTEISDIKYANTITVYIERDFSEINNVMQENSSEQVVNEVSNVNFEDLNVDGKISIGDIIYLDPELIIIPISDAEHLDENRSYISNIYESVKEKDDNWSEVINQSHFVRATFSKALGKSNDITVFARVAGYFCNESVIENCSEIIINETTNETSQSCVNVTIENCPEIPENEKGKIEIYGQDGNSLIAKIENITSANWYKTYLTGLADNETRDVFDLRIINAGNILVNNFVNINGNEVPYEIYQKKKRIDEINKILNGG